jgi:acetolactate synthase-1/2/3 large subunit
MLLEYQVDVIFGVPGDTSIPFYEALYDARFKIRHVLARDERSAAFMADAYARLTRKPGVCECPSGAGPMYALPGVAEANASSIPVVLITSDIALAGEGKKTITELDTQRLFDSITKWTCLVKQPEKIPETLRRAFRIATTGRPGAVHLAFPNEVLTQECPANVDGLYAESDCCCYPAYRTRGSRQALRAAVELLSEAERPVIIAGGGANHSQAGHAIIRLAEWVSAPVVTTISGQGIIPDEHLLALGVIGDNGFHPHAHRALQEGDLLLYVGCKMGSVSTIKWTLPSPDSNRRIIQIDLDPELLGNNYRNTLSVVGDARLVLEDILTLLCGRKAAPSATSWVAELNRMRQSFWRAAEDNLKVDRVSLKPQKIIDALNRRLTDPSIVIADAGTPTPYITRFLKLGGNGSRFIIPRSYGGLGYTIPALVGAHFAAPSARLVGLFGDGSLGMSAGEMETLARLQIPATLIHFNNASFGWIKSLQMLHSHKKFFSVDFTAGRPDWVANGFGLKAMRIETSSDLEEGLEEAMATPGPVFLDVIVEALVDEIPPVHSWLTAYAKNRQPIVHQ